MSLTTGENMGRSLLTKTIGYFALVVLISMVGFGLIVYNLQELAGAVDDVYKQELPRLNKAVEISYNSVAQSASVRGYLLVGDDTYVTEFNRLADNNENLVQELIKAARTEERKKLLTEIKGLNDQYTQTVEQKVLPLKKSGKQEEAVAANHEFAAPLAKALNAKVSEYRKISTNVTETALSGAVSKAGHTEGIALITALIATLLGVTIGYFSARSIAGPVNQLAAAAQKMASGDLTVSVKAASQDEIGMLAQAFTAMVTNLRQLITHVQSNSEQVAAASQQLTAGSAQAAEASSQVAGSVTEVAHAAERQLTAVDEASAVVEQMSASLQQVAANTTIVAESASQAATTAKEGGNLAVTAVSQMREIEQAVELSAQVVGQLGERSKEIGQIVGTISGIASQTNLLALNAAIEAARAGDQGRGFAVVAEEVRKLAEQSQTAAKQIAALIKEVQGDTERAVTAMDKGTQEVLRGTQAVSAAGISFEQIAGMVTQVSGQVQDISAAVEEMASGSQIIVGSIKEINKLSKTSVSEAQTISAAAEEQSASMQEIASSGQSLADMAQQMQLAVSNFTL